jgi:uncharacterized protein (UPF0335 family)
LIKWLGKKHQARLKNQNSKISNNQTKIMTEQLILSDGIGKGWQTIDFGGLLDWQRNDISPVVISGGGKFRFLNFDASTFGGPALFEIMLPRKRSRLPANWELEIEFENINAKYAEGVAPADFDTVPRFFQSNHIGHTTGFRVKNVKTFGLSGLMIKGGYAGRAQDGKKAIHIDGLIEYDPNPDIYEAGQIITFEQAVAGGGDANGHAITQYAALKKWNDIKRSNEFSRHALGVRNLQNIITTQEDVLIENVIINTMQGKAGDELRQRIRIFHDMMNTVLASMPELVKRDADGIVQSSGAVVRNVAVVGHATPEVRQDGCPFLTDALSYQWDGQYVESGDGQVLKYAANTLFKNVLSINGMNVTLQTASKNANFYTDSKTVAGEDFFGTGVRSPWNGTGAAQQSKPVNGSEGYLSEFSKCEAFYFNTRKYPGIYNFVDWVNGRQTRITPEEFPDGTGVWPYKGARANVWRTGTPEDVPAVREEFANWFAEMLPENMREFMPFSKFFGVATGGGTDPDPDCDCDCDCDKLAAEVKVVTGMLEAATEHVNTLKATNAELAAKNATLVAEVNAAAVEAKALQASINALKIDKKDLTLKLEAMTATYEKLKAGVLASRDELKRLLNNLPIS